MTRLAHPVQALVLAALALLTGCATPNPMYRPADHLLLSEPGESHAAHVEAARRHLARYKVPVGGFATEDQVVWNLPFERRPPRDCEGPTTGLLLIHGLSDSPYIFRDLAGRLAARCVRVRTVLLPGHGTRPGDLVEADLDQWLTTARVHTRDLAEPVDRLYVGGFSIGGALATLIAANDDAVDGLVALAPAWELNGLRDYLWLGRLARPFVDFVEEEPERNPVKYESLAVNAAVQVGNLRARVQHRLETGPPIDKPLFLVAAAADSVINLDYLQQTFRRRFHHADRRMIVYRDGRDPLPQWWWPAHMTAFDAHLPAENVIEFSHMAINNAPDNPLYGRNGRLAHCLEPNGGVTREQCLAADRVYYSAWRDSGGDPITARLTWNPHFDALADRLGDFLGAPRRRGSGKQPLVRTAE